MVICVEAAPCVVHAVSDALASRQVRDVADALASRQVRDVARFEVRTLGLRSAAARLGMVIADLGSVARARALADVEQCPVCRTHARPSS